MTNRARKWMVLLAWAGVAAAASSTYVHARILADPGYTSFCDINTSVSCTAVYQSRYGSVFGVPVALGGVVWFVGVLLLAWAGPRAPVGSRPHVAGYLLVWSTLGLAVAMYMAYASFFVLGTVCVLCVVVYAAVVGIFVLAGNEAATPTRRLPGALVGDLRTIARRPVGLALLVAFVAGSLGASAWFARPAAPIAAPAAPARAAAAPAPRTGDQQSEFERFWEAQPRVDLALAPDTGSDGTVTVVKFNDYQCPACASAHRVYAPVFAKYASSHPGRVRQVTLDFPLDPECNDQVPNGQHTGACEAAVAARLAAERGPEARSAMEEWLYANQEGLSRETVVAGLAEVTGIDQTRFDASYAETIRAVQADIAGGTALPVEATPTYVVNGVVIKGGLAPQFFDAALAYELARAETGAAP